MVTVVVLCHVFTRDSIVKVEAVHRRAFVVFRKLGDDSISQIGSVDVGTAYERLAVVKDILNILHRVVIDRLPDLCDTSLEVEITLTQ